MCEGFHEECERLGLNPDLIFPYTDTHYDGEENRSSYGGRQIASIQTQEFWDELKSN